MHHFYIRREVQLPTEPGGAGILCPDLGEQHHSILTERLNTSHGQSRLILFSGRILHLK